MIKFQIGYQKYCFILVFTNWTLQEPAENRKEKRYYKKNCVIHLQTIFIKTASFSFPQLYYTQQDK